MMIRETHEHAIQRRELCDTGERAYFQAFLDEYENRFNDNLKGYCEHVRYKLPLAFGVGVTFEQVAEREFSNILAKTALAEIVRIVNSNNLYSNE